MLVKRDKTRKKLMVDHPDSGELVEWKSLPEYDKKWVVRNYFKEYFDEAYNEILFALIDPDEIKEEAELAEIAREVGKSFLGYLAGRLVTT